eukprot:14814457-Heterocapsa_arctica.AAC.1
MNVHSISQETQLTNDAGDEDNHSKQTTGKKSKRPPKLDDWVEINKKARQQARINQMLINNKKENLRAIEISKEMF